MSLRKSKNGRPMFRGVEVKNLNVALSIIEELGKEVEELQNTIKKASVDAQDRVLKDTTIEDLTAKASKKVKNIKVDEDGL